MRKLALLFLFLLPGLAAGQNISDSQLILDTEDGYGYYVTLGGERISGVKFSKFRPGILEIPEQRKHPAKIFYPGEIREYGLERGDRYYSAEIQIEGATKKVFLEAVFERPEYSVLVYAGNKKQHFFLHRDDQTVPLSDQGAELRMLMRTRAGDCPHLEDIDNSPMKMTLWGIRSMQNAYENCNTKALSRPIRFGISAALTLDRVCFDIGNDRTALKPGFMPAVFVDIPLDSRFSIIPEIGFKSIDIKFDENSLHFDKFDTDSFHRNSLYIPVLFRYTATNLRGNLMPFAEVGPAAEIRLSKDSEPKGEEVNHLFQSTWMYGMTIGAGMEYFFSRRHSLLISLRYNWATGHDAFDRRQSYKFMSLNVGFTL